MDNYKRRFVEVDEVIKNLPKDEFDKIPNDIIKIIRQNKDVSYIWKYDKSKKLTDQNLHKDTIAILAYINTEFILEGKQKELMRKIHNYNEIKKDEIKREKFNPNLFKLSKNKSSVN